MAGQAKIGIIMGSLSDWPTMKRAADVLDELGVAYEAKVVSAHRTPKRLYDYAETAKARGLKVIIAGAGGAAHLPGMTASMTQLPVLGVPVASKALSGQDSLLSIVQMPAGVPVGTLAIGKAGATNAGTAGRADPGAGRRGARQAAGGATRQADSVGSRGTEGRCLRIPAARRSLPARPSASSAAASSAACWRWPRRAWASRRTSIAPTAARPSTWRRAPPRRPSTIRAALRRSPAAVDAVTYEFENVPSTTARHLARLVPVRPSAKALEVAQDRLAEKEFIAGLGIPVAPFRAVDGPAELTRRARRPRRAGHPEDAPAGLRRQGPGARRPGRGRRCRLGSGRRACPRCWRSASPFALELSALVVRGAGRRRSPSTTARATRTRTASCAARWCPRACRQRDLARARDIAGTIAGALDYVGVLAVEMFHLGADAPRGRAPDGQRDRAARAQLRPLDHRGLPASASSRTTCAPWPAGRSARRDRHSDAEMVNLIGAEALDWQRAGRRARRLRSTSTASARRAPGARWATSRGCWPLRPLIGL